MQYGQSCLCLCSAVSNTYSEGSLLFQFCVIPDRVCLSVRVLHPQYLEKGTESLGFPLSLSLFLFLLFVVSLCVCPCSAASTDLVEKSQAAQKLLKVVIAGLSEDAHSEEVRKVCNPSSFFFLFLLVFSFF